MKNTALEIASRITLLSFLMAAGTVLAAEDRPWGATDPFRPYEQRPPNAPDQGASHEGLYLNTDLGVNFVQHNSSTKPDPGLRFSIGPGYTLYNVPTYEVGAQFETGVIWNRTRREQTTFGFPGGSISEHGDYLQVPFLVDIVYALHLEPNLVPYLGIGGGVVYRDISSSTIPSSHSTDGAFQVMTGLRFRINECSEIGFGYKFLEAFHSGSDGLNHTLSAVWVLHFD